MEIAAGIVAGMAAAKAGIETLKIAREMLQRGDVKPQEVVDRLVELTNYLLEARVSLVDAQEEIASLKCERDSAVEKLRTVDDLELVFDGHFYVRKSEKDVGLIPYCPTCWTLDGKLVHLLKGSWFHWECPIHKRGFPTKAADAERRAFDQRQLNGPEY